MIKVFIDNRPSYFSKGVFVTSEQDGKHYVAKPIKFEMVEIKSNETMKPPKPYKNPRSRLLTSLI